MTEDYVTVRELAALKGQVTKLRKRIEEWEDGVTDDLKTFAEELDNAVRLEDKFMVLEESMEALERAVDQHARIIENLVGTLEAMNTRIEALEKIATEHHETFEVLLELLPGLTEMKKLVHKCATMLGVT